jgi:hypothetical protein
MPDWLDATLRAVLALGVIGGVFWLAFARPPKHRDDGGLPPSGGTWWSGGGGS